MAGETNVQGEKVKKLDVIANQLMINMLRSSYTTCLMVSEENESEIEVDIERQVTCLFGICCHCVCVSLCLSQVKSSTKMAKT